MNRAGSVLAEALIAVVIMSVSVTVIMQALFNCSRDAEVLQDYSRALFLLDEKLEEVSLYPLSETFNSRLDLPAPIKGFYYTMDLKDFTEEQFQGLKQIDLAIHWPAGHKDRSLDIRIMVADDRTQTKTTTAFYN